MIDTETELVGRLGDVEPLPDDTFDQARSLLHAAIALEARPQVLELSQRPKRRRRTLVLRGGFAAGVAAVAAAVAFLAVSPGSSPGVPAASNHAASPLVRLADHVSSSITPAGDATLVARTTALGGGKSVTVYDLYADNGQYFFSRTASGLPGQVSAGHNRAGGLFAREIAAARLAATGNVQTAGEDMAAAPDPSKHVAQTMTQTLDAADASKEPGVYHAGEVVGTLYDNYVWENSQDALIAGSGDPQVRAGVLQLLATLPDVSVTSGTSKGRPTLVLTAGADEMGAGSIEQLTINATTGIPISAASGAPGQALSAGVSYQVSRVTAGDIAAGKF
jgi:hypothetical protein